MTISAAISFDDLDGTLDEGAEHSSPKATKLTTVFSEPCPKCKGTGSFFSGIPGHSYNLGGGRLVGPCFTCKGSGKLEHKTSPQQRAKGRAQAATRKANTAEANLAAFAAASPAHAAWLASNAGKFDFATSLQAAVAKYGHLTAGQAAAVDRLLAKDALRNEARTEKAALAKGVDVSRIVEVFATATKAGLKAPKLRVGEINLSLAKATSQNAGSVYVKKGETYLGKISQAGVYSPSREATPADIALVEETAKDPKGKAREYGRRTGTCSCCGRELTDSVSIANGIGPICESNFGL